MKKKKVLILGAVLLGTAFLLPPLLLSSGWVQKIALKQVNQKIPGELEVQSCRIGWWQGLHCSEVVYKDAEQHLHLARLQSSQGLWQLITNPYIGSFDLQELTLVLPKPQTPEKAVPLPQAQVSEEKKQELAFKEEKGPSQEASQAQTEIPAPAFIDQLDLELTLEGLHVRLLDSQGKQETLVHKGRFQGKMYSSTIDGDIILPSGKGEAKVQARFHALPLFQGDFFKALDDMKVQLVEVQTSPFLALYPGEAGLPQGRATLSGHLEMSTGKDGTFRLRGPLALTDIDLTGGFLGPDNPRFGQFALDLDMYRDDKGQWQLPNLQLFTDFASLSVESKASASGLQGSGKGKIDLPILLGQFPHLLKIQEDLRLDRGMLQLDIELSQDAEKMVMAGHASVDSLAGRRNQEAFAWDSPLALAFSGSLAAHKKPEIEQFILTAPFLHLEGHGDMEHFSLKGKADLGQALKEINRLIQFEWNAAGHLQLDLDTQKHADERYTIKAKVDIQDYQLSRQGKEILPPHNTSFTGQLSSPGHFPEHSEEAASLSFDLSSWAGTISGSLDGLHRKNDSLSTSGQIKGKLMLGRVTELLHIFEALDQDTSLAGTLNLQLAGYTEEDRMIVRNFDGTIQDFILYQQGKIFRDPQLHLFTFEESKARPLVEADSKSSFFAAGGGYSFVDPSKQRLVLRNVAFQSSFADLKTQVLALDNWPTMQEVQLSGTSQLKPLTGMLHSLGILETSQQMSGNAAFTVELTEQTGPAGNTNRGSLALDLDRFVFASGDQSFAAQQKIEFRTRLHGDLAAGDIYFTTFDLLSEPLSLQSSGKLERTGENPHLALEGNATPDLASFVALLQGLYPLEDFKIRGGRKEPFSLYYPLGQEQALPKMEFAVALHADTLAQKGILLNGLALESTMKQGRMNAVLQGELNGGRVKVAPQIDYTQNPPLLTLPQAEQVLENVGLERALADGLLKGIHPLLGTLAKPVGSISVRADRFSLPLGEQGGLAQADFLLFFDLGRVFFEPQNALSSILEMAGLANHPLLLRDKGLTCEGKQGRISCSPIKITVADSEMILSGSVGLDGSLDYVLEVPVTQKLVGKRGYELLKGAKLKVPIRGTKDLPIYNPDVLLQAASELLSQAAGHAAEQVFKEQVEKVLPDLPGRLLEGIFRR